MVIFLIIGLILWAWSIGCIIYAFYGFSKAHGDVQQQAAALIMGLGGALFFFGHGKGALLGVLLMLAGTLMAFNLLSLAWINAVMSGSGSIGEPRPVLGTVLMVASLPFLAIGSIYFCPALFVALLTDSTPSTSYLVVGLSGMALGGGLFYVGYSLARLREQRAIIRWPAIGAAILAASWYGLATAPTFVRHSRRQADKQMAAQKASSNSGSDASAGNAVPVSFAPAPASTVVLASSDGAFSLELPSGWQPMTKGGTVLAASRGAATISISATGGPATQEDLRRRMQRSQKKTATQGYRLEGKLQVSMLDPGQPLVFYRCKFKDAAYLIGGFTIGRHSYSLLFKNLSNADMDAVGRSLTRSAQTAAGGGPQKP